MSLEKYKILVVLKKNLKGQVLSPKLVTALNYMQVVFEVNLTTESHRAKIPLKRFRSIDSAMVLAKKLNVDLGIPVEKYNPLISDKMTLYNKCYKIYPRYLINICFGYIS